MPFRLRSAQIVWSRPPRRGDGMPRRRAQYLTKRTSGRIHGRHHGAAKRSHRKAVLRRGYTWLNVTSAAICTATKPDEQER